MKPKSPIPFLFSAVSVLGALAVLAVLDLLGVLPPAEAQLPRPSIAPYNTTQLRQYATSAAFPWTITVCKGVHYGGDYKDLSEALEAIPARFPTRGVNQRILVKLYPCDTIANNGPHYEETALVVPSWVTIQGESAPWNSATDQTGRVVIRLIGTSGTLVTTGQGASYVNVYFQQANAAPTGAISVVDVSSPSPSSFTNVQIQATNATGFPVKLLTVSGNLVAHGLGLSSVSSPNITGLFFSGTGNGRLVGGAINISGGVGVENAGSGAVRLYGTYFISTTALADLKRSSSGVLEVLGVDYLAESGIITGKPVRTDSVVLDQTCQILTGTGSPEGITPAPVCSIFLRQDGSATTTLYVKTTGTNGNTGWTAK
jgi:hypothetical protein